MESFIQEYITECANLQNTNKYIRKDTAISHLQEGSKIIIFIINELRRNTYYLNRWMELNQKVLHKTIIRLDDDHIQKIFHKIIKDEKLSNINIGNDIDKIKKFLTKKNININKTLDEFIRETNDYTDNQLYGVASSYINIVNKYFNIQSPSLEEVDNITYKEYKLKDKLNKNNKAVVKNISKATPTKAKAKAQSQSTPRRPPSKTTPTKPRAKTTPRAKSKK